MTAGLPTAPLRALAAFLARLQPSLADLRVQRTFITASYAGEWVSLSVNLIAIGLVIGLFGAAADWRLLGPLVLAWLVTSVVPMVDALRWRTLLRLHGPDSPVVLAASPLWLSRYLLFDLGYAATVGMMAVYLITVRPDTVLFVVIGALMIHLALVIKDICLHFAAIAQGLLLLGPLAVLFAARGGSDQPAIAVLLLLHLIGVAAFARDLSHAMIEQMTQRFELQRLSADLARARDEAERANVAKSRFFASASHDLRQPMHALTLLAHSLARDIRDPELAPMVNSLSRAAEAAAQAVRQMLDISRIDAGLQAPSYESVSLASALGEIALSLEPRFAQQGVALRIRPLHRRIVTDPMLLQRIVSNLLDNALVHAEARRVLVTARRRGALFRIAVWDDGRGIEPEPLAHVFEELYQVGNPQRDRQQGLGLGLAIVRRLARQLGGEAGARSRSGHGSVFWIDLPAAPRVGETVSADAPPPTARAPNAPPALPRRVLVLDDDAAIRTAVAGCLAPYPVLVEQAANLPEALAAIAASPTEPRSLVVDYRLGAGSDGIDAVAQLRTRAAVPLPALLVTGDTTIALLDRARAQGLRVLTKPVSAPTLLAALEQLDPPTT